jgi:hypothetical protein
LSNLFWCLLASKKIMEFLFMISAPFLGYYLNRNGKQSRDVNDSLVISRGTQDVNLLQSGNRSLEVRRHVQGLAGQKHPKKLRDLYGGSIEAPINVFADDGGSGFSPAPPSSQTDDSAASRFERQVGKIDSSSLLAYDPSSGTPKSPVTAVPNPVQNLATFRSWAVKGPSSVPMSPLTGLPLDLTHGNMQPFFGKQSYAETDSSNRDTLLERFTGRSDYAFPENGRERRNDSAFTPNNFPQPGLSTALSTALDRATTTIRPSNEYVKPFKGFRDSPEIRSGARVLPPNIDEVRGPGNLKQIHGGGVVLGQLGSTRPMQPGLRDNRYDLPNEEVELLPTQAAIAMGSLNAQPSPSEKPSYENDYVGIPTFSLKTAGSSQSEGIRSTRNATVERRQETWTPSLNAPTGRVRWDPTGHGAITARDPEKGHAGGVVSAPHQSINHRLRNVAVPDTTARELTQLNPHSGNVNPSAGSRTDGSYKLAKHDLPITNKVMNSSSTYIGAASGGQSMKMYPMEQKHDLTETYKEMNSVNIVGNPDRSTKRPPVAPEQRLAETMKSMNLTEQRGNPTGLTRGPMTKPVFEGGPTIKETTLHAVTGNPQGRQRSAAVIGTHERNTVTDREMNQTEHSGAPRALVPAHMSYEAVFDLTDSTVENDYMSAPRNPAWRHTKGPGESTSGTKEELVVERFGNPESREKGHEPLAGSRENTRLSGREEIAGQIMNPYHPIGAMTGHESEVSLKDGLIVEGRFETGSRRDGKKDRMSFSFDLRDDQLTQEIPNMTRTLPRALMSPEPGVAVRAVNNEALNPRLDDTSRPLRLTSDLYPVVSSVEQSRSLIK